MKPVIQLSSILLAIIFSGCISEKSPPPDTAVAAAPASSESPEINAAAPSKDTTSPSDTTPVTPKNQWALNYQGIGKVQAGMRVDQVNALLDNGLVIPSMRSDCEYMSLRAEPKGVSFLFENGTLSVVSVKSGTVRTVEGVGIGDTEKTVNSVYEGRVVTQPAKYTSGHRLIVTPKNNGNHRLVFETENGKVTQFASGREPAVEYVEGCG
jgi:hypothetical protein